MMRGYHQRRRSTLSLSIWAGAFVFLSALLAWKFQWLPGSETPDSPVEETAGMENDEGTNTVAANGKSVPQLNAPLPPEQSEPGNIGDFNMPERFNAPVDPKAASKAAIAQAGFDTTSNSKGLLNQTGGVSSPGTRIRTAGFVVDNDAPPAETQAKIDRLIQARDYLAAHKELSEIYWKHPNWRRAIRQRIEMTAKVIYFDRQRHFLRPYVVKPNDALERIARPYGVSAQYLARLNGVTPRNIRPGDKLKVMRGPFSVVVDLSDRELTVHHHGYFVCRYPVGIGRDMRTPIGKFKVDNKIENPRYEGRDERGKQLVIGADDPRNPLGEHWISIGNSYGIHGTIDPKSIGKAESKGCVRMHNADVAVVYDFLTNGSEVVIQE